MEKQIDFDGSWGNEYDNTAPEIIPGYHLIYELTQHLMRCGLSRDAKILVAGAGTGRELIDFSRNNPHWSFTGVDPAEQMLSFARNKIQAASLENRITLVDGRVEDVGQKVFDAATAILVMQFLPDDGSKLHFLKSICDHLKPGGLIILVDLEGEVGSSAYNTLNAAWRNQQLFTRRTKSKIEKEFMIREKEVHFITQDRIESLLKAAGFHKLQKFFQAYLFGGYVAMKREDYE